MEMGDGRRRVRGVLWKWVMVGEECGVACGVGVGVNLDCSVVVTFR